MLKAPGPFLFHFRPFSPPPFAADRAEGRAPQRRNAPGISHPLRGSVVKATASSESVDATGRYPVVGVIDGVRSDAKWGQGHRWASRTGQPPPHWIEIAFSTPRPVARFIVINYGTATVPSSAAVWGVKRYDIEVWDDAVGVWKTVLSEPGRQTKMAHVHNLETPIRCATFRVLVREVAPGDKRARLLQVEAWGRP